nr:replication protein A 70 kDa DNA-binding subunit B [Tanacetum cinerariifolium]
MGKSGERDGYCLGSCRCTGGDVDPTNVTMLKDVDPMLDNIIVQGCWISLWHSHRLNEAHNPYSLDMVLQDSQDISLYKKEWVFCFEPLFKEGQCYSISNFAIAENSGRLPLLPHKYKISFYKETVVTRIVAFDDNVNGFILEPYIIGSVVAIGDIVPVQSAAGRKIHRTDEYALKREELGHVVFILQLGKVKYWDGTPLIHNTLFGTKMFINRDLPEMLAFGQRFKELPEYDESQFKISLFTPQKPMVTVAEFFHRAVKKMVSSIIKCEQKSHCIVYAKIHRIHKENRWAYTVCKKCNKKVNVVKSKASSSNGKNKVTLYCEDDGAV